MSQLKRSTNLKAILQKGLMWFPCAKPLFEFSDEKKDSCLSYNDDCV